MNEVRYVDLRINQGSRLELGVFVSEDGAAKDLNGYTARMQIREFKDSTEVLAEYTTENGLIQIKPTVGQVVVKVPSSVTEAYDWGDGVYDLEIVDPGGDATRIVEGRVVLSKQVTR